MRNVDVAGSRRSLMQLLRKGCVSLSDPFRDAVHRMHLFSTLREVHKSWFVLYQEPNFLSSLGAWFSEIANSIVGLIEELP